MKKSVLLGFLLLFFWTNVSHGSGSFELIGGGLTYHLIDHGGAALYSYKVSSDGRLIANPVYGAGITFYSATGKSYFSAKGFGGRNSVAQPINGGILSVGTHNRYVEFGLVGGGYIQNDIDFLNSGITPFSLGSGPNAFVPIIGIELNFKIYFSQNIFLKILNVVTPIITNDSLSLGFNY